MPRKKKASVSQQFEGSFNVKNFEEAINQIEAEHQVPREEIENIIKSSFDKACRDTLNPFKAEGLEDIRTETIIDEKNGQISTYTLRDVKNEDDIEDDLLEVSLEEAQEKDKDIKVGDVLREKVDYKEFNYLFFRKVIQIHQQADPGSGIGVSDGFCGRGEFRDDHGGPVFEAFYPTAYLSASAGCGRSV